MQGEEISRGRIAEMSSKELVKTRFFSTGHGVKLEGSMNYAKGKSWALLLSSGVGEAVATRGVDSELRLNRKQQALL